MVFFGQNSICVQQLKYKIRILILDKNCHESIEKHPRSFIFTFVLFLHKVCKRKGRIFVAPFVWRTVYKNNGTWSSPMHVWRMAHILPNHCGLCSICDIAKYTVFLFGRNSCLLYTISVVCHINLTNGWMTVLLPCQIDTRQGLQVLYVIVGQKPLVC